MVNIGSGDLTTLIVLAVILLGALLLLRAVFKLTSTALKLGCAIIFLIVAGAGVVMFML